METNPDRWFKYYLNHRLNKGKKRLAHSQGWIAKKAGVSQQYISQIANLDKTQKGKDDKRRAIVAALEDDYETAYKIGMELLRNGSVTTDHERQRDDGVTDLNDVVVERRRLALIEHTRVIQEFEDFEAALKLNRDMAEMERRDPEEFRRFCEEASYRLGKIVKQKEDTPKKDSA